MSSPRDIILGDGIFSIAAALSTTMVDIAVTRGGGNFNVTNTFRKQEADGDRGWVKGRIAIDEQVASLTLRALEILPANINKFYPAMESSAGGSLTTIRGLLEVASGDYQKVRFTGKTKGGNAVQITVDNAINMEPWNWDLIDKNEVVPELKYTATSLEASTSTPSWDVTMATT